MSRPSTEDGSGRNCANDVRLRDKSESSPPPWQTFSKINVLSCLFIKAVYSMLCQKVCLHRHLDQGVVASRRLGRLRLPVPPAGTILQPFERTSSPRGTPCRCLLCAEVAAAAPGARSHTRRAQVSSPTHSCAFLRTPHGQGRTLDAANTLSSHARQCAAHLGRPSRDEDGLGPALLGSRGAAPAGTHAGAMGTLRVMRLPLPPLAPVAATLLATGGIPATEHVLPSPCSRANVRRHSSNCKLCWRHSAQILQEGQDP